MHCFLCLLLVLLANQLNTGKLNPQSYKIHFVLKVKLQHNPRSRSIKGISFGYLKNNGYQSILQAKVTIRGIYLFSAYYFNCDIARFSRPSYMVNTVYS